MNPLFIEMPCTMPIAENYIFGQWVKDHAPAQRGDSINPATGEKAAQFVAASVQEVDAAIACARTAFETTTWSQQPKLRSDVLRLFADRLEHNKAQVVQTLVQLNGKLQREAEGEVMAGISELRYYAGLARNLFGRVIEMEPEVYSHIEREAIGVAAIIVPWNAPVTLLVRSLAPAMAAGCTLFAGLAVVVAYASRVLQRQEMRIVETERLAVVGEMASAVAHGLRNPLAAIRSCAELTMDDDIPDHSRESIRDITNQVDRLESWIRAFLIRSRNDPGSMSDQAQIDQVIQRCLENFEAQMRKRGIRWELKGGSGSPVALAQPSELEQVLNSIISNSIEAMSEGGKLGIGWANRADGKIAVTITDTGPGIAADMAGRLFKPFETGKSAGLGVGLALGRRIVERMGGSLDLRNGAKEGVEVILILPGQV